MSWSGDGTLEMECCAALASERMLGDVYCESDDGAAAEVDEVVDRHHFQIQDDLFGSGERAGEDQRCTDIAGLPHVKFSSAVARLDLEDVEGAWVARGGLHLEYVSGHTPT